MDPIAFPEKVSSAPEAQKIDPRKFREIVCQVLYAYASGHEESITAELIALLMREILITKRIAREAQAFAQRIWEQRALLDLKIAAVSQSYALERIQKMELSILRFSLYVLFFQPEFPPKMLISEAIRLCRKFSTPESASFVNALLDALWQDSNSATESDERPSLSA